MNGLQNLWKVRLVHVEAFVQVYVLVLVQADVAERAGILALDVVTLVVVNAVAIAQELAVQHVQVALETAALHAVEAALKVVEVLALENAIIVVVDVKVDVIIHVVANVIMNVKRVVTARVLDVLIVVPDVRVLVNIAKDAARLVKAVVLLAVVGAPVLAAQDVQENA